MKTKVNLRTGGNGTADGDQNGKGKRLVSEKKTKNVKRALFKEIEEDEEIGYLDFKRNDDSIEDYYDDDDEYIDDNEGYIDEDYYDDDDEVYDDDDDT